VFRTIAICSALLLIAAPARAGWKGDTVYHGAPNLTWTAELIAAGGGAQHFDARRAVAVLAGSRAPETLAYLRGRYGARNVDGFFRTLTFDVDDAVRIAGQHHIALPPVHEPVDGRLLSSELYHAGVMPNGRYDVGYMLERLLSHPIHMYVMWDSHNDPAIGKRTDEMFHIILTDAVIRLGKS
jgi:hypothetical protein